MEEKHTPGPWFYGNWLDINSDPLWVEVWSIDDEGNKSLPFVACKHIDQEANARLIAAAPDLLEALQAVLANCMDSKGLADAYKQARAAIAKATNPD